MNDFLEKGKAGQLGEIRVWGCKKYQKTAKGWRPIKSQEAKQASAIGDVRVWGGKEYVKTEKGWRPKPKGNQNSPMEDAEIVETKAFAVNEFENRVNAFVKYNGKSYAVTTVVPKEIKGDSYGIYAKEIQYLNSDVKPSAERDKAIIRALRNTTYSDFEAMKEGSENNKEPESVESSESRELSDILKDISYFKENGLFR